MKMLLVRHAESEGNADGKGAIVAVGNHLPPNIPGDMMDKYFDTLLPRLTKE